MYIIKKPEEEPSSFYREALELLNESKANFMLGGAFALFHYTGIHRDTKDLDIYCKSTEYPAIMKFFSMKGYRAELHDVRWLVKLFKNEYFIDVIFDTVNNICRVDDDWFEHAHEAEFVGVKVKILAPEELIWCKIYVQNRERFDGADVNHLILKCGHEIDWKRLLDRLNPHWHLLLAQIIMFQFVYPADFHDIIPKWLFDELMERAYAQYELPPPVQRVCRGAMIDQTQYGTDINQWGYKSYTIKTV